MQRRQIRVDDPPTEYTDALKADSAISGRSVNDIASGILASHYGHDYSPTGKPARGLDASGTILKVPEPVWFSLRIDAASNRSSSIRSRVIDIVRAYYEKGAA